MKKTILVCLLALSMGAQAQTIKREGNQFVLGKPSLVELSRKDSTVMTIKDTDGKVYPLYISGKGRAYTIRVSKQGKTYRKYMSEEQSRAICLDLGIEYIEKKED